LYVAGSENGKDAYLPASHRFGREAATHAGGMRVRPCFFSPDGKTLLYNSGDSGSFEVYTANADGTNPRRLTHFRKLVGATPVTIYFNQAWRITKKESFAYYRKASLDTNRHHFNGPFEDYDSTGHLIMGGTYVDGRKNGPCTTYHLNGSKASLGNYQANRMQGRWEYYYPNGKLKQVIDFNDTDYRIISFFDSLGNARITEGTGAWYDYFGDNAQPILLTGQVVNGLRQGSWIITARTGERLLEETFEMGTFKGGTQYSGKHGKKSGSSLLGKQLFEYPHLELAELLKGDKHFYGPDAIDYVLGRDPFKSVDPTLTPSFPGGEASFAQFMAKTSFFLPGRCTATPRAK
jgi:antitoxin component YwqK of YwqJK toxin-antitoxin module